MKCEECKFDMPTEYFNICESFERIRYDNKYDFHVCNMCFYSSMKVFMRHFYGRD